MQEIKEIKGIIFDKDGTLFDYQEVWGPIVGRNISTLLKVLDLQKDPNARHLFASFVGLDSNGFVNPKGILFNHEEVFKGSFKLIISCIRCHVNPIKAFKLFSQLLKEGKSGLDKILSQVDFTAVRELFNDLEKRGIAIGIVTNDDTQSTKICLESIGISDQVQFLRTKDSNCKRKPNPQAIKQFCVLFQLKPEEIAVVGDTNADMTFAERGKVGYKVGLLSGSGDRNAIDKIADVIYPDISYLLKDPVINRKQS